VTAPQSARAFRDVRQALFGPLIDLQSGVPRLGRTDPPHRGRSARNRCRTVTPRLGEWVDADREFRSTAWWEAVRWGWGRAVGPTCRVPLRGELYAHPIDRIEQAW